MANRKRKCDSDDAIREKIRKLESRLSSRRTFRRIMSTSSSDEEQEHVQTRLAAMIHADVTPPAATHVKGLAQAGVNVVSAAARAGTTASATTTASASTTASAGTTASPATPATAAIATDTHGEVPSTSEVVDIALDEDILMLLGNPPEPETDFGKAIHKDIASRWQEILAKGLSKDVKDKLLKEYLVPKNCDLLIAPILNPEVKAALPESMAKRDSSLSSKQKQIGIALAALAQTVELVINKEACTQKILKPLGDACRILCDSHFCDTRTRRGFVIGAINADLKETIIETKRDKFLFGSNIAEQVKSAKTIKRSGSDLKQAKNEKSQKFNKNNFIKYKNINSSRLNWKTTPRKPPNKPDYSRPRPTQRPVTRASFQQGEKSERSPARRSSRRH